MADDEAGAELGVSQLVALADSELLDDAQQLFVDAALGAVVGGVLEVLGRSRDEVERSPETGVDRDVPSSQALAEGESDG